MTSSPPIISVRNLGIRFREGHPRRTLRSYSDALFRRLFRPGQRTNQTPGWFWALRDVTFTVQEGQAVGLVGLNGAGKSTLMQAVAGIYLPTEGQVEVRGRITAVLGLNVGFVSDLSGRENIYLVGLLLGLSERQLHLLAPEIIEFTGLQQAIDRPVKHYSSGMRSRLSFSIMASIHADILLLDEIMAVGDGAFRKRCEKRMDHMVSQARTILICSHNLETMRNRCQNSIWLECGRVRMFGPTEEVLSSYEGFLTTLDKGTQTKLQRKAQQSLFLQPASQNQSENCQSVPPDPPKMSA